MVFSLTIECDKAAFEDDPDQLAKLLRQVADRVDDGQRQQSGSVRDANGNKVGTWEVR